MTDEQMTFVHMHTVDRSVSYLFNGMESLDVVHAHRKRIGYLPFLEFMEIEPGLKPLLRKLKPGFKTAVATNRSDTMEKVIFQHGLEGYFDLVVCSLDVKRPKPDPESLIKIFEHFDCGPDQMIYVGDSSVEQMAAAAASVSFVAFNNTALAADYYISSLAELETILGF